MSDWVLRAAVALIVFNRPRTTQRVFAEVARARPRKLFLIADGPRRGREAEPHECAAVRRIVTRVDWPCDVETDFAETNLGCGRRISSGLDWLFSRTEEAIILEDDCLPEPSFFRFADELLERYRHDNRVRHIGGSNFQFGRSRGGASYYFSRYPHVWGWASWRRAWQDYDAQMQRWPALRAAGWLDRQVAQPAERAYWLRMFDRVQSGQLDTWDYQWTLSCWAGEGLSVIPNFNLISNIGFGASATHTGGADLYANLPTSPVSFPLRHPASVARDVEADAFTARSMYTNSLVARTERKLRGMLGWPP
jgi:hypothetical protein